MAQGALDFSPGAGGLTHAACTPSGPRRRVTPAAHEALVRLYTARIGDLAREPLDPSALREIRHLHDLQIPHLLERRPAGLAAIPRV